MESVRLRHIRVGLFSVAALWLLYHRPQRLRSVACGQARTDLVVRRSPIFNTLGILELVYIVFFLKKWPGKADAVHHEHHNHDADDHHEHNHAV